MGNVLRYVVSRVDGSIMADEPRSTLRAQLSGTFLQTLPDLVTSMKGHSLSPRSCSPTRSAPSERFGYECRSTHVNMRRIYPG